MTKDILGYTVESVMAETCVADITTAIKSGSRQCRWMACLNPHSYVLARKDAQFNRALNDADWLVPDGVGILIAGRFLGRPLAQRITGSDIFEGVMHELNLIEGSVFFLGSTERTLDLIAKKLPGDYPNVRLAGTYSPPFKPEYTDEELKDMIAAIASSKADVLWVGMTAPKQEKWLAANRGQLPVQFAGAIGAVFDFYTDQVRRSHPIFQKLGLEWLPRLLQQPKRLWGRMFVSAPIFLWDTLVARAGKGYRLRR